MDQYEHVRKYPLNVVLAALGFETFAVLRDKLSQDRLPAVSSFGWSVSDEQCRILAELTRACISACLLALSGELRRFAGTCERRRR